MKLTETIEENYAEVTGKNNLRIIQTNADPNIEKLLDIYDRSMQRISSANAHDDFLINNVQTDVGSALKYYQSINDPLILSSNLIKEFCFALSSREKEENFEYSGIFLTGLIYRTIKEIKETKFTLITSQFEKKIKFLGKSNNGAEIIIDGDSGNMLGKQMRGGSLYVTGNAYGIIGNNLQGGKITIEKDVLPFNNRWEVQQSTGSVMMHGIIHILGTCRGTIGENMYGGTVIIEKDILGKISEKFQGGIIYANGNITSLPKLRNCKGIIYHKDVQIFPRKRK